MFNIRGVLGAAGLYFSNQRGKNGFGLFADISSVLSEVMFLDLGQAKELSSLSFAQKSSKRMSYSKPVCLNYNSINPSNRKKDRIERELYKLHRRSQRMRLH